MNRCGYGWCGRPELVPEFLNIPRTPIVNIPWEPTPVVREEDNQSLPLEHIGEKKKKKSWCGELFLGTIFQQRMEYAWKIFWSYFQLHFN